jgi:quercetin dioxygenase-like cupin family protein
MSEPFKHIPDLSELVSDLPADSILSRDVYGDDHVKVILFGFAPGQELSEHTSARPAILHFLEGEADLMLGDEAKKAHAGTWVRMSAHLPHSIRARTPVRMLLMLLPASEQAIA